MQKVRIHILSNINNPAFEPPLNQIADDLLIVSYLNQMMFVYIPVNIFFLKPKRYLLSSYRYFISSENKAPM